MEIPAFFASYIDQKMMVSDGRFSAVTPKAGERFLPLNETIRKNLGEERTPVVIVDCDSFELGEFSEKVMKHLRVPGKNVWLMTYIRTVEDVFDAFNKDAEFVLAPYHFITSDAELRDICNVSDSVVPVISIHKGKAIIGRRRSADAVTVLEKLVSIGYYRNFILDSENSLDGYTWSVISEDYPSTIPIVDRSQEMEGFHHTIMPFPV